MHSDYHSVVQWYLAMHPSYLDQSLNLSTQAMRILYFIFPYMSASVKCKVSTHGHPTEIYRQNIAKEATV